MPSEPASSPRARRSSLWWISALLLALMIASGLLPIHRPSPGFAALNTRADHVFGQPDFTSSAAPNPPSASSMNAPGGVTYDLNSIEGRFERTEGMVFVSDTGNNRVLGWNAVATYENGEAPDWVIGQPDFNSNLPNNPALGGLSARTLNQPTGLTLLYYELYVADTGNNRVLRFEYPFRNGMAASLVLGQPDFTTNEAGMPSASSLNAPTDVATDAFTAVFVADQGNNRVVGYEGDLTNGMDATLLMGQPDFEQNAAANPPNAASLNAPTSVDFPASSVDRLYVADTGNNRVVVYNREPPDLIADRVFGQPDFTSNGAPVPPSATSLNQPRGLGFDLFEQLYVADTGNNRVLLYRRPEERSAADEAFGQPDLISRAERPPSAESLQAPVAVAPSADPFRDLVYIADSGNNRVLGYQQTRDDVRPIIYDPSREAIVAGSEGFELELLELGVSESSIARVNGARREWRFLGTTGSSTYIGIQITAADVSSPGPLVITMDNTGLGASKPVVVHVYRVAPGDIAADAVLGQEHLFEAEALFRYPDAQTLSYPSAAAVDPRSGRLFVADSNNYRVLSWPSAAAFADFEEADLVFGQPDLDTAVPANPELGGRGITRRTLDFVFGLAVDPRGNLYVADSYNNRVLVFAPPFSSGMAASTVIGQTSFTSSGSSGPNAASLNYPMGLAVDGSGTLFVADRDHNRVLAYADPLSGDRQADRVFGQGGSFTSSEPNNGGVSAESLNGPSGVELDQQGTLYVADYRNNRVLAYRHAAAGDTQADRVFGQGDDFSSNDPNNGGVSAQSLNAPLDVAVDRANILYVADSGNHRVLTYSNPLTGDSVADQVFGQNGDLTTGEPGKGGVGPDSLYEPASVAVDPARNLLIVDNGHHRVLRYDVPLAAPPPEPGPLYLPLATYSDTP